MALSLLSAGLWAIAVVWQVVALGGGPAALALVTSLAAGGMLASTPLGGALADRVGAVMGAGFQAGMGIWGTLLQRRVPPELLGRVSSLDFFVSLSFMPLSMALAGTVSEVVGLTTTFLVAGLTPPVLAVVAILAARMPADEIAHPLDAPAADEPELDRV
jgi:hypothetical protein